MRKWCSYCKIQVRLRDDCRKLQDKKEKEGSSHQGATRSQEHGSKPLIKCFNSKQEGHIASKCPGEPAMLSSGDVSGGTSVL